MCVASGRLDAAISLAAQNESALPALIDIVLDSKVVTIDQTTITIPPRQSHDVTFYILPFRGKLLATLSFISVCA